LRERGLGQGMGRGGEGVGEGRGGGRIGKDNVEMCVREEELPP